MKWTVLGVPGNVGVFHKQRVVHHRLKVKEHGDGEHCRSQLIEVNLPYRLKAKEHGDGEHCRSQLIEVNLP